MTSQAERRWLERRRKGVGASEVAMVMGLSRWGGAHTLYARKRGLVPDQEVTEYMTAGHMLEPAIVRWFKEDSGFTLKNPGRYRMWWHPNGVQFATPDRLVMATPATVQRGLVGPGVVDVKNTGEWMADEWSEDAPLYYQVQLQQQMECTNTLWGVVCALIGGNKLRWKVYEHDPALCTAMETAAVDFWHDHVLAGVPPPADDATAADMAALKQLHPDDDGESVALPGSFVDLDRELVSVKERNAHDRARIDTLKAKLFAAIGSHTYGELPNGGGYSLKTNKRGVRVLRRMKGTDA